MNLSGGADKEPCITDFFVKEWEMTAGGRIHYLNWEAGLPSHRHVCGAGDKKNPNHAKNTHPKNTHPNPIILVTPALQN